MPIELIYDCASCPAGLPRQFSAVLAGFVPIGSAPDVNGPIVFTSTGACGWMGTTAGGTNIFLSGASAVGFLSTLTWSVGGDVVLYTDVWDCDQGVRVFSTSDQPDPFYSAYPTNITLTPVDTPTDPNPGGGGAGSAGGFTGGFPSARHHGSFLSRAADGKAVYGVRCAPSKIGGRTLATYAGRKDGKAYYGAAECGPLRVASFLQRLPDGKALYAFADPCCGPRGSGSGSVASGSRAGSVSGSVSGSSGSGSGSVSGSGSTGSTVPSGVSGSGAGPVRRVLTSCGRTAPVILYLVFDGPLAGLGTIRLDHGGGDTWFVFGFPDTLACNFNPVWDFGYDVCTGLLRASSLAAGSGGGCIINFGVGPYETLTPISDLPFLDAGALDLVSGTGCLCGPGVVNAVITETPP